MAGDESRPHILGGRRGVWLVGAGIDLMNFVYQNFRNHSNYDVFQVVKACLDLRKQEGGRLDEVDRTTLEKALRNVPGSLSPQIVQYYNL